MTTGRTLPLRLSPIEGEALDSWLEALAATLRTPMGELLTAAGLLVEHRPSGRPPRIRAPWLVLLRPYEAEQLSVTTGVAPAALRRMTLEHYDRRALVVDRDQRVLHRTRNWRRSAGTGSRFCPDCLAESGGRWQLTWRFGWSYACLTHRRLLADTCPQCGGRQRRRRHADTLIPAPGLCDRAISLGTGPRSRCPYPLHTTETLCFAADHPALLAQRDLVDAVATGTGAFGVYRHAPQAALDVLADVKGLGRRALFVMPGHRLAELVPSDLLTAHGTTSTGVDAAGRVVSDSAAATAATITAAWSILGQDGVKEAAPRMRLLLDAAVERGNWISPTVSRVWARYASPWLQTVHAAAVGPTLRSVDQLRYRSAAARPGSPSADAETVARRAAQTPAVLWPRWEARLDPPSHVRKHLGAALSAALMLVDSRAELAPVISRHLGALIDQPIATHVLQALREAPQWNDIQVALIRLAEYLDGHEVPIDYARRRRLDYAGLLSQDEWVRACERAVQSPGAGVRYHVARCLLFERISGLPGTRLPQLLSQSESFRAARNRFPYLLTPELLAELDQAGRAFLVRQGIDEEPLVWEPPTELLDGLDLPRLDPECLDLAGLHRRVQAGQAPARIARSLGADLCTLRFVLTEHPAPGLRTPRPRLGRPQRPRPGNGTSSWQLPTGMQIARAQLPRDVLVELYVHQHGTFLEIAEQRGLDRKHVARLVDEYALPRHPIRPRQADGTRGPKELLDRAWLHAQYAERNRSFKDIGQELGVSAGTVARWAARHKIPRHNNRHLSRPDLGAEAIPDLLRPVLGNNYQLRRLRTFLQVAGYPSLQEARAALGMAPHTVTNHLRRLEEDLGGPLLLRTLKNRPMEPTELGHQVLAAARPLAEHLGVPSPAVPADASRPRQTRRRRPRTTAAAAARLAELPALLQPAAGTYGGRRRLRRFLAAVRYPTVTAFARAAGLDSSTVTLQIVRLERDFDGQLLVRGGNKHAMQLTRLGKRVVAAAQPYADQLGDLHGPRHKPKAPSPAGPTAPS